MEKRYQVFISSTFNDLLDARQEVMQALLELDCIPAGMELFPAADEDQWTLIKRVIDDCDYYIVIVAGRYGSIGPDGKSYTQMEYEYALSIDKPVIGFLHKDPSKLPSGVCEKDSEGIKGLETFRELVGKKVVKYWSTPADLGSVVSRSLVNLIKRKPAVGWVKADRLPSEDAVKEILSLRKQIDDLRDELDKNEFSGSKDIESLSQGDDLFEIPYTFAAYDQDVSTYRPQAIFDAKFDVSWEFVFSAISPQMIDEASDSQLRTAINNMIAEVNTSNLLKFSSIKIFDKLSDFKIADNPFDTIKVQLLALGFIQKSIKNRSVRDKANYWSLTHRGEAYMTKTRAIRRDGFEGTEPSPSKDISALEST